jgi:hypothetical protein
MREDVWKKSRNFCESIVADIIISFIGGGWFFSLFFGFVDIFCL